MGLGTGTLAIYGRSGDVIRFYELNPAIGTHGGAAWSPSQPGASCGPCAIRSDAPIDSRTGYKLGETATLIGGRPAMETPEIREP